jgi:hypothetical protein
MLMCGAAAAAARSRDEKTLGAELRVAPSSTNSLGLITVHLSLIKTRTDTIMHSLDFVPPLRTGESADD